MGHSAGCFYAFLDVETGKPLTNRVYINWYAFIPILLFLMPNSDGGGGVGIQRVLVDGANVYFIGAQDYHAWFTIPNELPKLLFNVPARGIASLTCQGRCANYIHAERF